MSEKIVLCEVQDRVALLTINRPDKLNALNKSTIEALSMELDRLQENSEVRGVILTGSGTKAFVAGADISEFADFDKEEGRALAREGQHNLFDKIAHFTKPVIAAVNGFALGGGLELAMAAHIRLASPNAKLGLPEVSLGVIPGYGGTQRLPELIGKGRAFEMIFTGKMIGADEAQGYGLVNRVVPAEDLITESISLMQQILRNSSSAIAAAITCVNAGFDSSKNGYEWEINAFGNCFGTEEFTEGTTAFLEKRKPQFG
jgi:enoyl-CoA hydratase